MHKYYTHLFANTFSDNKINFYTHTFAIKYKYQNLIKIMTDKK